MGHRWNDYEDAADFGPIKFGTKIILGITILACLIGAIVFVMNAVSDTASVAKEQYSARAVLTKYEWFKDASAQLQKKQSDIAVYAERQKSLVEMYNGIPRSKWARVDQEAWNLAEAELAGVKASYNALAAEYNAQSSKFNWSFAQGDVPQTIQPLIEK